METTTASETSCEKDDRQWYSFLASSLVTFGIGFFFILIYRLIVWLCCRKKRCMQVANPSSSKTSSLDQKHYVKTSDPEIGWMTEAKDWAGELISGQTTTGRILVGLVFLLSIASLIIYFIDASSNTTVETCLPWSSSPRQQVDLAFNVFFMIYFFIRFVAANDKLWFWVELFSFVDYFTIPPSFVAIYLDRNWLGK
ncbi:calcium-activated potassium channel subunit alpha-1 [Elysia marginata]|uniref:Calcium-activated potassium channel subunit alpha-1 n=1 Tax=Elysia marginata TaxID=1093978 RepID=A0AAV4GMC7_9GAST|nr:calcium-activated potassium channel subunit alpha-1 [Elysia marginata]